MQTDIGGILVHNADTPRKHVITRTLQYVDMQEISAFSLSTYRISAVKSNQNFIK